MTLSTDVWRTSLPAGEHANRRSGGRGGVAPVVGGDDLPGDGAPGGYGAEPGGPAAGASHHRDRPAAPAQGHRGEGRLVGHGRLDQGGRLGAWAGEDLGRGGGEVADLGRVLDPEGDPDRTGGAIPGELDAGLGVAFGQAVAGRGQGEPDLPAAVEAAGGGADPQPGSRGAGRPGQRLAAAVADGQGGRGGAGPEVDPGRGGGQRRGRRGRGGGGRGRGRGRGAGRGGGGRRLGGGRGRGGRSGRGRAALAVGRAGDGRGPLPSEPDSDRHRHQQGRHQRGGGPAAPAPAGVVDSRAHRLSSRSGLPHRGTRPRSPREPDPLQDPTPQMGRGRHRGNGGQQGEGVAVEGTQGASDLVAEAAEEHLGVAGLHAHGLGQFGALQAVAQVEVEQGAVAFGQAGGGVPDELAQVGPPGRLAGAGRGVGRVGHLRLWRGARPGPGPAEGLGARRRVQPGTQPLRVAELAEALGRGHERVLAGVGRLLPVAQHRPAEVVQPVGVAVVDGGEGAAVAGRGRPHELGVAARVGTRSGVHSPPEQRSWPGQGPSTPCAARRSRPYPFRQYHPRDPRRWTRSTLATSSWTWSTSRTGWSGRPPGAKCGAGGCCTGSRRCCAGTGPGGCTCTGAPTTRTSTRGCTTWPPAGCWLPGRPTWRRPGASWPRSWAWSGPSRGSCSGTATAGGRTRAGAPSSRSPGTAPSTPRPARSPGAASSPSRSWGPAWTSGRSAPTPWRSTSAGGPAGTSRPRPGRGGPGPGPRCWGGRSPSPRRGRPGPRGS